MVARRVAWAAGFLLMMVASAGAEQPAMGPTTGPAPDASAVFVTPGGVKVTVVAEGQPHARKGDVVWVRYSGHLANGIVFDASDNHPDKAPLRFTLGNAEVIKGWDEGLLNMEVGEKRQLVIPPALGYGAVGQRQAGIPPNATLYFDVELIGLARVPATP